MTLKTLETICCDVLVIGGGGAGLTAAIHAREMGAEVILVSKSRVGYGNNTYISKGVFASATGHPDPRDNPGVHIKDSVTGGRFINDQKLLSVVAEDAGNRISFLEKCGAGFYKQDGSIQVTHTPGHMYPRHVRGKHQSGKDFILPLRAYAGKIGVRFREKVFITRLFAHNGGFTAATGIDQSREFFVFSAKCVVLATGGFAQTYLFTNNAAGLTGDGQALGLELGLPLKDMEFVQFYPTAMGKRSTRVLLYEAFVFRSGGVLRNSRGDDIIEKHGLSDPKAMTRDRLTRAIMVEILEGRGVEGGIIMDLSKVTHKDLTRLGHLLPASMPPDKRFRVSPTAHFCMGGIITDEKAATEIEGLFAAGEVCAGVHGANRLAGNALSEVFTMGGVAGTNAALAAAAIGSRELPKKGIAEEKERLESFLSEGKKSNRDLRRAVKEIMWYKAGIIRSGKELEEALEKLGELGSLASSAKSKDSRELIKILELQNMLVMAGVVCRAALFRKESRGAHYRIDYPEEDDDNWLKNIVIRKKESRMVLEAVDVTGE